MRITALKPKSLIVIFAILCLFWVLALLVPRWGLALHGISFLLGVVIFLAIFRAHTQHLLNIRRDLHETKRVDRLSERLARELAACQSMEAGMTVFGSICDRIGSSVSIQLDLNPEYFKSRSFCYLQNEISDDHFNSSIREHHDQYRLKSKLVVSGQFLGTLSITIHSSFTDERTKAILDHWCHLFGLFTQACLQPHHLPDFNLELMPWERFSQRLKDEHERARRFNLSYALLTISFTTKGKKILTSNLKNKALDTISPWLRLSDIKGSANGEEIFLFAPLADRSSVQSLANRIALQLHKFQLEWEGELKTISVQVGASGFSSEFDVSAKQVVQTAERALVMCRQKHQLFQFLSPSRPTLSKPRGIA